MSTTPAALRYTLHVAAMYAYTNRPGSFRRMVVRGPFNTEAEAIEAARTFRGNPNGAVCFVGLYAFRTDDLGAAHSERYTLTSSNHEELNALVVPRYRMRLTAAA